MTSKNYYSQIRIALSVLCAATIILTSMICNAADLIVGKTELSDWKKVVDFGPISAEPPAWCGNTAIVAKAWDWQTKTGGIVYVDVINNTTKWITRDRLIKNPSCNYDGSLIFMYKMKNDPKLEEGHAPDGIWSYDLKTGKSQKIGNATTDFIDCPASPTDRIFAVVAHEKKYLKSKGINLQGWSVLTFPKNDRNVSARAQWASDGSYFLLRLLGKEKNEDLEFYDKSGVLIRTISTENFQMAFKGSAAIKAKKDGVYWLTNDGHLRRLDLKTGQISQLSFQTMINKKKLFTFDISPAQEIAYNRNDQNDELWIASLFDNKAKNIGEIGLYPLFSKTGEYMAFVRVDRKGNGNLSVMQRVAKE